MSDADLAGENLGPALEIVSWLFAAIAIIVVCSRYYVRTTITRRAGIDDWLIFLTLCLALADSAFCTVSVHWGLGRHIQFLSEVQIKYSIKYVYLCEVFAIMCPGFGRISFALLLLGIIPPTKWRRRFLWTIISIQFVVDVGTVIISFCQCRPIQGFWDTSIAADCWPAVVQQYTGYFQGSVCSLVDLLLAIFPSSLFWSLNMKLSTKISLSALMGLGIFAMIASIVKTVQLRAITEKGDATYAMAQLAISWTLEAYLVLIAASIPTLKPLLSTRGSGSRAAKGSNNNALLMKSWASKYHPGGSVGAGDLTVRCEGPFTPLQDPFASRDVSTTNVEIGDSRETRTYHHSKSPSSKEKGLRGDGIKQEVTMEVSYDEASSWETNPLGNTWLPMHAKLDRA